MFNLTDIKNRQNTFKYILSITISLIPASMVVGAAFMEFFIILSCLIFFYLNLNDIGLNYYKRLEDGHLANSPPPFPSGQQSLK